MKIGIFIFMIGIAILPIRCNSQSSIEKVKSASYLKWKKAIVNLECRKGKWENLDSQFAINNFKASLMPLKQLTGTAVFLIHEGKRYLITARHVLYDKEAVEQRHKYHQVDPINDPYSVFLNIHRIPSEEEISGKKFEQELSLALLSVPSYEKCPFVFSEPEIDLAIISLDGQQRFPYFAEILLRKGYEPISLSDIDTTNLSFGDEIFCAGFPMVTHFKNLTLDSTKMPWNTNLIFEPAFTYGHVSNPKVLEHFFLGDISVLPGNSGGPVIRNNRMVGIVSSQGKLAVENSATNIDGLGYRVPYAFCARSKYIPILLRELIAKDKRNAIKR